MLKTLSPSFFAPVGVLLAMTLATPAFAAVNLGSDANTTSQNATRIEKEYSQGNQQDMQNQPANNQSIMDDYTSTLKMRQQRKVGAGFSVGGPLGVAGANLELNFEDENGAVAGFGTGPGYDSFQLAWKHAFDGDYIAPYTSAGYSHWYNSHGHSSAFQDSGTLKEVLTDSEKADGRFGVDFIFASLGLQYNQLSGDFAGVSFYGEVVLMEAVERGVLIPTGTVGATYFF